MPELSQKEYRSLLDKAAKLDALEAGGVDNWQYYDISMEPLRKERELNDATLDLVEGLLETISLEATVEYPAGRECGHSILISSSTEEWVYTKIREFLNEVKGLVG